VKIRFLKTYTVKDEEGRTFHKGEVYDLPEASAAHFVNRRRAVAFEPEDEPVSQEKPPATKGRNRRRK
jgi:hypothetical protein